MLPKASRCHTMQAHSHVQSCQQTGRYSKGSCAFSRQLSTPNQARRAPVWYSSQCASSQGPNTQKVEAMRNQPWGICGGGSRWKRKAGGDAARPTGERWQAGRDEEPALGDLQGREQLEMEGRP